MQLVFEKTKNEKIPQLNFFKLFYEEIKDKGLSEDEIFSSYDHTEMFFKVMYDMIVNKEPWVNAIVGDPASGKSTIMWLIVKKGNDIMRAVKFLFKRENGTIDEKRMKNFSDLGQVVADQNEFLGLIKEELWSCFIGVDEYNRLADTGLNSSIDTILNATYSDIFAQQNVNRVSCSPSTISDINTWLVLEIYGKNKKEGITTCKLIYRDIVSNTKQIIGRVDFDVKETLKEEGYKKYRERKFKRMELLQRRGIRKFSEMIISEIVLKVYEDLEKIVFEDRKVDPDVVLSSVKQMMKELKFFGSMLTETEVSSEVRNLLGLKHNLMRDSIKVWKEESKEEVNKDLVKRLKFRIKMVEEKLKGAINYHKRMEEIHKEYLAIK